MARMHSKKKGKSRRRRVKTTTAPSWADSDPNEIKERILQMSKEGTPPSRMGLVLRDQYAVPNVRSVLGMRLEQFLKKEGQQSTYPADLINLIRTAMRVREHLKSSRKDNHNKVKLTHIESKIQRLVKYYTRVGRLPAQWRYDPEKAALLVK